MKSINITNLGRNVFTTLAALGNSALDFSARVDFVFDQLTVLFVPTFGKRSTGTVYAFARITKPGVWTLSPRRADFAIRTS